MNVHMYITHSFVVILEWRWMIGHLWLRRCGTGARVNTRTPPPQFVQKVLRMTVPMTHNVIRHEYTQSTHIYTGSRILNSISKCLDTLCGCAVCIAQREFLFSLKIG